MEIFIIFTILLYMLSAAGYFAYLFFQKEHLFRTAFYLVMAGFLAHTLTIGYTIFETGQFPVRNLHETLSVAGWAIAGVFLVFHYKFRMKILGIFAVPLVSLIMVVVANVPNEPVQIKGIFKSFWVFSHVIAVLAGDAAFALAFGLGILYLVQERGIKTKNTGFFFKRLPSLEMLDSTAYACIVIGFSLLTFGLITGFLYAKVLWGKFWSWDPKEVWSGITWLFYAALLHIRLALGWRGRRAAVMAIIGFGFLLFTFFGVNFLLEGHHGSFTRINPAEPNIEKQINKDELPLDSSD